MFGRLFVLGISKLPCLLVRVRQQLGNCGQLGSRDCLPCALLTMSFITHTSASSTNQIHLGGYPCGYTRANRSTPSRLARNPVHT